MQELFGWHFSQENIVEEEKTKKVIENLEKIDSLIKEAAPAWPLEKINRVDLAILRLGVFELIIDKGAPVKVVVDEAVELAKEYGGGSSASFVNGVLGKLITDQKLDT